MSASNKLSRPRRRGYKILRAMLVVLILFTILLLPLRIMLGGFIDFPCFVRYDETGDCISMGHSSGRWDETPADTRVEVFLTTYLAGWSGGGCRHKVSGEDSLDLKTDLGTLSLERDGETLKVGGKIVEKSAAFKKTRVLYWDPWIIGRLELTNAGVIVDCEGISPVSRLVVVGRSGTQVSLVKGILILAALVAAFIYVHRTLKAIRD